jgi:serine protease Do
MIRVSTVMTFTNIHSRRPVLRTKGALRSMQRCCRTAARIIAAIVFAAAALPGQDSVQDQEERAIQAAVNVVAPAVLKIETIGGLERVGRVLVSTGPTTGLAVSQDGFVISSAFNFVQQPSSILVTLPSGKRAPAQIVARDHSRMLVLLKVNASEMLSVATPVPKNEMTVGQWAIAVGRTYEQAEPNVSVGVISATNRIWSTAIQTDAKISPANYGGPLVDIHGRVLGILVPLSPQKQGGEVAGAEWYDSGIGFAIPLTDILEQLPKLKAGKDLYSGVMGIALKSGDPFSLPAELAASQAGSPAYKAGLRSGDTIVQIDSAPIARQSQLKHALGPRYAGEKVHVIYTRGKETQRRQTDVELAEKLIPYDQPFLGILPMRDGEGVRVRYIYPDSPAMAAGLKPGDRIAAAGDTQITDAEQVRTLVANLEPKTKLALKIERGGETLNLEVTAGKLPTDVPDTLPPAIAEPPAPPDERPKTGVVEIKLPEEKSDFIALIPDTYHPKVPHGIIVVLSAPGVVDREKLASRWKAVCEERHLIVLAPMSSAADKWQPTDTEFIKKTLDDCIGHFNVDPNRIAVYGYQAGGAMAYLSGFENPQRVRAIVAIDAIPPLRVKLPETDPINRLAFFIAHAEKSSNAALMKTLFSALESAKFPVTKKSLGTQPRDLTDDELTELGRWIDALDRI